MISLPVGRSPHLESRNQRRQASDPMNKIESPWHMGTLHTKGLEAGRCVLGMSQAPDVCNSYHYNTVLFPIPIPFQTEKHKAKSEASTPPEQ